MRVKASSLGAALMAVVVASYASVREFASHHSQETAESAALLQGGTCYVGSSITSVEPFNKKTNTNTGVVQEGQGREVVALWFSTSKAAVCV